MMEASNNEIILGMGTYRYFGSAIGGNAVKEILAAMKKKGHVANRVVKGKQNAAALDQFYQ
jgi:hypothetical protein